MTALRANGKLNNSVTSRFLCTRYKRIIEEYNKEKRPMRTPIQWTFVKLHDFSKDLSLFWNQRAVRENL